MVEVMMVRPGYMVIKNLITSSRRDETRNEGRGLSDKMYSVGYTKKFLHSVWSGTDDT